MVKRSGLGKGLGALINDADKIQEQGASINEVKISSIEVNPFQPRSKFNEEKLEELSQSIKELGLIQPLTLRKVGEDKYQIIAGERRFRAAKLAGLVKVPAFIREAEDDGMLELALVENIQREDLDAIEVAFSYERLIEECNLTQDQLSTRVGKKRSTIANYLRLLKLPALIQKGLRDKQISMGHARALINIKDDNTQVSLFNQTVKNDLSVRKVEEMVRELSQEPENMEVKPKAVLVPQEYLKIKDKLASYYKSPVNFSINSKGKGKITIPFNSKDDFDRIVELLKKGK